jgi:hypothetical protein
MEADLAHAGASSSPSASSCVQSPAGGTCFWPCPWPPGPQWTPGWPPCRQPATASRPCSLTSPSRSRRAAHQMTVRRSLKVGSAGLEPSLTWSYMWSYGDSNPRRLACHEPQADPLTCGYTARPAERVTVSDAEQRRHTPVSTHLLPNPLPRTGIIELRLIRELNIESVPTGQHHAHASLGCASKGTLPPRSQSRPAGLV